MTAKVDMSSVVLVDRMTGEDEEETALLRQQLDEARAFLSGFAWCAAIEEEFFGCGVGGVVAVFLFRIVVRERGDEALWIVTGDLPPCYLVTDDAPTPLAALNAYCDVMEGWTRAVRGATSLDDVYPVNVEATSENADMLETRIQLLRQEIIPALVPGR